MLPDISGQEVEQFLLENQLVQAVESAADAPTDRGCSEEQHEAMRRATKVQFIQ
jgi:monothiol glutaredoxin